MTQPPQHQPPRYQEPQHQQPQPRYQQTPYQQAPDQQTPDQQLQYQRAPSQPRPEWVQQPDPEPGWGQQPGPQPEPEPLRSGVNGFAVASLVLGIFAGVLLAVIFGIIALAQIRRTGQKGRGLAVAGLALSGVWLAGIGVAIGFVVGAGADRDANGRLTGGGSISATELKVGDCLNGLADGKEFNDVPAVPCAQPHAGEVYAVFDLTGAGWPGAAAVADQAEQGCNSRLGPYAPRAVEDDTISLFSLQPTQRTWDRGDREVTCVAVSTPQRTGSIGQ